MDLLSNPFREFYFPEFLPCTVSRATCLWTSSWQVLVNFALFHSSLDSSFNCKLRQLTLAEPYSRLHRCSSEDKASQRTGSPWTSLMRPLWPYVWPSQLWIVLLHSAQESALGYVLILQLPLQTSLCSVPPAAVQGLCPVYRHPVTFTLSRISASPSPECSCRNQAYVKLSTAQPAGSMKPGLHLIGHVSSQTKNTQAHVSEISLG